jgi:hypothetical protein
MAIEFQMPIVVSSKDDTHGYHDIAKQIADAVLEFKTPVTVALSGVYGSGKSSIAAMALKELGFRESAIRGIIEERGAKVLKCQIRQSAKYQRRVSLAVSFFDAALWEDIPDLFEALMLCLVNQFGEPVRKAAKDSLRKALHGALFVSYALGVTKAAPADIEQFKDGMKTGVDVIVKSAEDRLSLRKNVGDILKHMVAGVKQDETSECRLLVILDNLDRVEPEQTLNLLKSIYLYISKKIDSDDIPIFILACFDREIIEHFLAVKGIADTTSYLSKYIDYFWSMPLPKRKGVDAVVSKLLKDAPEHCFDEDNNYPKVLEGMLHRAGVTTPKMLEMVLRRFNFLLHFYWKLKPTPTLEELYRKVSNKADLLKEGFGLRAAGYFYSSLMYMRWPWLYNAFYLLGLSGKQLGTNQSTEEVISELAQFCKKEKLQNDPYAISFLQYYHCTTLYFNPGVHLPKGFRPAGVLIGPNRDHVVKELQGAAAEV